MAENIIHLVPEQTKTGWLNNKWRKYQLGSITHIAAILEPREEPYKEGLSSEVIVCRDQDRTLVKVERKEGRHAGKMNIEVTAEDKARAAHITAAYQPYTDGTPSEERYVTFDSRATENSLALSDVLEAVRYARNLQYAPEIAAILLDNSTSADLPL